MDHNITVFASIHYIMSQDVALGITTSVAQADLAMLRAAGRLGEYAVIYRVHRLNLGGGFGDQARHPLAWAVMVYADGLAARIYSARGEPREWNNLDRLERWLRDQGFWYWWTRNDLEAIGSATSLEHVEDGSPDTTTELAQQHDTGDNQTSRH